MSSPPPVFAKAQVAFAEIAEAKGLAQVHDEYNEAAFGSAYTEHRGGASGLRLVWDGKDAMLFAEVLVAGRWEDVETIAAGRPLAVDHDQSDQRIARVLRAAGIAPSSQGRPPV
jgi:hypothetical protein